MGVGVAVHGRYALAMPPSLPSETMDVVIVGGRPAGATLAMRLAKEGLRVLVLERATFPSAPPVSVPFLMNNAMALLDELDLPEAEYAGDAPRLRHFVVEIKDHVRAPLTISRVGERDYIYVIDRGRFDTCLWRALDRYPTVTKLEGVSFQDVVRDESGRVTGVRLGDGRVVKAGVVVGADGRYSPVARAVGAEITEERTDVETSLFYAYWTGWAPYDGDPAKVQIHGTGDGFSYIVMPTTEGRAAVVFQGRADRFNPEGAPAEACYLEGLRRCPAIHRRLGSATMVSKVSGIKKIGNLFRRAAGPGWALVGDAFHQKDSIDAQGIYDALLEAKLLAGALAGWKRGAAGWDAAVAGYEREAVLATRPMFLATMDRLKREIYTDVPPLVAKSVLRWMMTDAEYMRRFAQLLSRQIAPADFAPPKVLLGAIGRGIASDLRRLIAR